jgi:hypothetical protein
MTFLTYRNREIGAVTADARSQTGCACVHGSACAVAAQADPSDPEVHAFLSCSRASASRCTLSRWKASCFAFVLFSDREQPASQNVHNRTQTAPESSGSLFASRASFVLTVIQRCTLFQVMRFEHP